MSVRDENKNQVRDHAWKGTWDRPMKVDEESLDPLTVARMTDHNVRGMDETKSEKSEKDDGGKLTAEETMRILSKDLPP